MLKPQRLELSSKHHMQKGAQPPYYITCDLDLDTDLDTDPYNQHFAQC